MMTYLTPEDIIMTIKEYLETINYKITSAEDFCWNCYGENTLTFETWNGDIEGVSSSIIFDSQSQKVYEVFVIDYGTAQAFRWVHPEFVEKMIADATDRDVDHSIAADAIKFVDLTDEHVILEKIRTMVAYEHRNKESE